MKRRSPWLTFAACVLLRGSSAYAEPAEKLALSISKASAAAEAELAKLGLASDHVIASVALVRSEGKVAYYSAKIEPPISPAAIKDFELPKDIPAAGELSISFKIEMNGAVTLTQEARRQRIRVINSKQN